MDKLQSLSFKDKKAIFGRLEQIASQANLSQEERERYETEWKIYNDYFNTIESAEKKSAAEAREIAMAEGLAEGRAKGRAEGRAEEQHRLAKGFKEAGFPIETIAQVTGLPIEEIINM